MLRTSPALMFLAIATAASGALIAQRASTPSPAQAAPPAATSAGDWPTYNRDPGGTRFSPLDEITPANVSTLEVAWVYHMKPAAPATPATPEATLPAGHETPPASAPPAPAPTSTSSNQTRGRRGYASSESTPLVVGGVLYMSTPYARVVALDPASGTEKWAFQLPLGQPVDARPGVLAGRRHHAGADRVRDERREALFDRRRERHAQSRLRRRRRRQPRHARDPARPARARWPDLAAEGLQAPRHHRRHDPGEPAARTGRRRARLGHAHGQAGVDVPLGAAAGRALQRDVGRRQRTQPLRRQRVGLLLGGHGAGHRLHAVRGAVGRSVRRRSRRRQPVREQPGRGQRRDRRLPVALPDHASRHLGRRSRRRPVAPRRDARRQDDPRRRRGEQAGAAVRPRSHHRQTHRRRRGAAGAGERRAARTRREDAAVPARHPAAVAHEHGRRRRRDRHAGDRGRLQEAPGGRAARRTVPAARLRSPARAVPRQSRRRQLGRHVVLARARLPVRQHQRARPDVRPDRASGRRDGTGRGEGAGQPRRSGRPLRRRSPAAGASASATPTIPSSCPASSRRGASSPPST